jgi:hypothetical protein
VYHQSCVKGLRKFGVNDAFPECRARLPLGPAVTYDAAVRLCVLCGKRLRKTAHRLITITCLGARCMMGKRAWTGRRRHRPEAC